MIKDTDLLILSRLRKNAREKLTDLSKKTNIPVSTIFDKMKVHQEHFIKKHTTLLDFSMLGFHSRANILIKASREEKEFLKDFLLKNQHVNSMFKVNNGFDFMIEGVFRDIRELEAFMDVLELKFKVLNKQVYYIIDEMKREEFLTDPESLDSET